MSDVCYRSRDGHPGEISPTGRNNEDNMSKKTYSHMLVCKISGIVASRHSSERAAIKALRAKDSARDPLELREYSEGYFAKMGR